MARRTYTATLVAIAAIPLFGNRSGIGITYDSTEYFAGAQSIVEGLRFAAVDGTPQATWPPGYSALLAVPHGLGVSLPDAAIVVNIVSIAVLAWSFHRVAGLLGAGRLGAVGAAGFLFLLAPVIDAGSLALSELPFLAALFTMFAFALGPPTRSTVVAVGLVGAFLYSLRYVGLFFLPFGVMSLFLAHRGGATLRTRVGHALVATSVAVAPIIVWTARNLDVSGTTTGNREPAGGTFLGAVVRGVTVMGQWITRQRETPDASVTATTFVGFVLVITLVALVVRHLSRGRMAAALIAATPIVFLVFNAYRYVNVEYAPIDQRTTLPAFAMTVLACATTGIRPPAGTLRFVAATGLTVAATATLVAGLRDVNRYAQDPRAWGAESVQSSPLAIRARAVSSDALFISNFPQRAFALVERAPIRNQYQFDLPQVTECERRFVLWFVEAPFQGNEPTMGTVLHADAEGSLREIGDCTTPPKDYWE